jgi:hypothetical protein
VWTSTIGVLILLVVVAGYLHGTFPWDLLYICTVQLHTWYIYTLKCRSLIRHVPRWLVCAGAGRRDHHPGNLIVRYDDISSIG